jgi:hypothetical protein
MHVLPLQQPVGQDVASQTHCPVLLLHSWPEAHAEQLAPPAPHKVFDSDPYGSHVLPLQQPFGQDDALHTHWPVLVLHCWPEAHPVQLAPPTPHMELLSLESGSHVDPLQQPAQDDPPHVHTPEVHAWPEAHAPQAPPAVPQSDADCEEYATHTLPLQQPFGQEAALQPQVPLVVLQNWPAAQAPHVAPPVPQELLDSEA